MNRRGWSSKSLGSRLQHAIFYRLIRIGGWRLAYGLLFFVVLWHTLSPRVQRRSLAYRKRRFPEAGGFALWLHCARLHAAFGKVLVDRAVAGISGHFSLRGSAADGELLKSLHAEGKGLILLTGHVGCWQMAAKFLRETVDAPVAILLHREAGDNDRHFFEYAGQGEGITVISPEGGVVSAVKLLQVLRGGGLVALMGDRAFDGDEYTERAPFMGGEIPLPYTAYRLASASGAPVAVFFAYREKPLTARHEIVSVLRVPGRCGREGKAYMPYLRSFASALEEAAMRRPYQFFNFYDMWE
ncbi:MAG: lysophospholipid acyltransferase family protein [Deltaproteobacteria bacterium]|jgi:predicted LPLAT superfamily acyltransferase|nr:lysophospholipid acyltransferase family protein [Deltaproteobacteria bacterium]